MREKLNDLFGLLNDIDVKGKKNLNNLLASIQLVEQMYAEVNTEQSNQQKSE